MEHSDLPCVEFLQNSILLMNAMRKSGCKYDYNQMAKIILKEFKEIGNDYLIRKSLANV